MEESGALPVIAWGAHFSSVAAAIMLFGASLFPFYAGVHGWSSRWNRFVPVILASILLMGLAASASLTLLDLSGDVTSLTSPAELEGFFFETAFGPVWLAGLAVSLLLFAVAIGFAIPSVLPESRYRQRDALFLILSAGIICSFAAVGHARSDSDGNAAIAVGSEIMHLLAAAAWLGGLPPLVAYLSDLKRREWESRSALPLLYSFSFMGQWAVAIIIMGGVSTLAVLIAAWHVRLDNFHFGAYVSMLSIKLSLLGVLLAIASINRFILIPGIEKGTARLNRLQQMVFAECVLGALVIVAATILSRSPPPI